MTLGIYCSGSLGKEIYNLILIGQVDNIWDNIIFIDDISNDKKSNSIEILTFSELKRCFLPSEVEIAIGTGEPYYRHKLKEKVQKSGYKLTSLISNSALIGIKSKLDDGVIIFPYCYIGNNVYIEENVIIHTGAKVESECLIADSSFISLGAFIGAETHIGSRVFIGPNATIKDNIHIMNDTIIGMGSVLINSAQERSVYVGNPARYLRENDKHKLFFSSIVNEEEMSQEH